ncbi:ribosome-releasing factor 2, mitochondrial-like [Lingula anatina]|uniref:Ribosome-releasing factor 2, mitochondrial-like n=1 Tax=Lingula anatina TaxID=7574 RepID=A0A1S3INC0_LINAN|nr:ribosome-releasing factor 2, mitochondrial-like [Lingula anatina]|eukprot:XP_013399740.1 ribosome-releasing factor 2, mitochondrial-like [Lingula anatina]
MTILRLAGPFGRRALFSQLKARKLFIIDIAGNVDRGDTVTDYMDQERDRGITITSAAVTFYWNDHKVNLIDTPGHIDFTVEVERSLRVLDGGIVVLDGSRGVEAQTVTVWRQANRYGVPRIAYINKLDKANADFEDSLNSIQKKLHILPLPLQIPVFSEDKICGVVDLITMEKVVWDRKDEASAGPQRAPVTKADDDLWERSEEARLNLIGELADIDEAIASLVLGDIKVQDIPPQKIHNAVRKVTLDKTALPVLCGSSLKNIGVQPLLDAVNLYLPSPDDIQHDFKKFYKDSLCALAFKTIHNQQRGPVTFLRLYNGSLKSGDSLHNLNRECVEKASRLIKVFADEFEDIKSAYAGDIIAVIGLKKTFTGDTLSDRKHQDSKGNYVLAGVEVGEPVFFCSVEASSLTEQAALEQALENLQKEDPSFKVWVDESTGEINIGGMGELHIEIIKHKLVTEYKLDPYMGPLHVSYKETVAAAATETYTLDQTIGNKHHHIVVSMTVNPNPGKGIPRKLELVHHGEDNSLLHLRQDHVKALTEGVHTALLQGPILNFPVTDVQVELHSLQIEGRTTLPMISAAATQCISQALSNAEPLLLQPMMSVEIFTEVERIGGILDDLKNRKGTIENVENKGGAHIITALLPLAETTGYATNLRRITSGQTTFSMELLGYKEMDPNEQNALCEKMGATGF